MIFYAGRGGIGIRSHVGDGGVGRARTKTTATMQVRILPANNQYQDSIAGVSWVA